MLRPARLVEFLATIFMLGILPVLANREYSTIAPEIIPPTHELCPSSLQLLSDRIYSVLSQKYFSLDKCGEGVWYNLVSINMSDPLSQCPDGWMEENVEGVRACGRGSVGGSCKSAIFSNYDYEYTKVCGRAIGYQFGHTDAFLETLNSINGVYVDGLSITYGSPRQYIWTFASGASEIPIGSSHTSSNCPCSNYQGISPPDFVGNNWYCESGNPESTIPYYSLLSNDPLWDGEDCEGSCCRNGKTPPWFSVQLPTSTNEDIEARICANEHSDNNEDIFIEIFEVYVQ